MNSTLLLELPGHADVADSTLSILDWLAESAARWGNKTALEGINRPALTHAGLFLHIQDVSNQLLQAGIGRGDVVLVVLPNGPEALTAILAVAAVAVAFPLGVDEPVATVEALLKQHPVKAILFEGTRPGSFFALCEQYQLLAIPLEIAPRQPAGIFHLPAMPCLPGVMAEATRLTDAAILTKTAGSTAEPKIIAGSQASLYLAIKAAAEWLELTAEDRSLCVMPLVHLHSLWRSIGPGLLRGGSVVCCPGFDKVRILDWISTYRPTYMTAVPGIYRSILAQASDTGCKPAVTSLRCLVTGSDRMDMTTVDALQAFFGVLVREFYGMSEVCPMLAATPQGRMAQADGAIGVPLSTWQLAFLDETGQALPAGQEGEIAARGGVVNPVVAGGEGRIKEGWYLTGDRGFLDANGLLHVTGRVDDRITRGGKKIAPQQIEAVLVTHPLVSQAVAFPIPDPLLGECVAALVVPVSSQAPTELELRVFASERLPDGMVPERIAICAEIPCNATGKLARRTLASHLFGTGDGKPATLVPQRSMPRTPMETLLARLVGELLNREDFDLDADLMTIGCDSFLATVLLVSIEENCGVLLSPAQFMQNRSVASLARLLDKSAIKQERIFLIQAGDGTAPLFFAHSPGGFAYYAATFANYLGKEQTLYALQWQEPEAGISLTLEHLARYYTEAIQSTEPVGPYYLIGHSFGGQLAFEIAQQLMAAGKLVAFLGVIDDEANLLARRFGANHTSPASASTYDRCRHLLQTYVPKPYSGYIDLFLAEVAMSESLADPWLGWEYLAPGRVARFEVSGEHTVMMSETCVAQWAACLAARISVAKTRHTPDFGGALSASVVSVRQAQIASMAGNLADEIQYYQQAVALDPEQPYWVYRHLAEALLQQGQQDAAIQGFEQALAREQFPLVGTIRLFHALKELGRQDESEQYIQRIQVLDHDQEVAHFLQGKLFQEQKRPVLAEPHLRRAIELQPGRIGSYHKLCWALNQLGRVEEALDIAQIAITIFPSSGYSHFLIGYFLTKQGELADAEQHVRQALELDPHLTLARTQLKQILDLKERHGN